MSLPARQMAGQPTGGQFVSKTKAPSAAVLRPIDTAHDVLSDLDAQVLPEVDLSFTPVDLPENTAPTGDEVRYTDEDDKPAKADPVDEFFEAVRLSAADPAGEVRHVGARGADWFEEPLFDDAPDHAREWAGEGPLTR